MRSSLFTLMSAALTIGISQAAFAAVGFNDNFDSEVVGTTPSTWTVVVPGANDTFLVTNSASRSAPNSFEISSPFNDGYEVARFFSPITLSAGNGLAFGYSLDVTSITDGATNGNEGFTISLGQGSPGGFAAGGPPVDIRVFSVGGSTTSYFLYQPTLGQVSAPLPINSFFDVFIEVTPTNANDGVVNFFLDGSPLFTVPYAGFAGNPINGVRIDAQTGTGAPGNTTYLLDNVFVVPEPASLALLALGGLLITRRRTL